MKSRFIASLLLVLAGFLPVHSFATILRVNNRPGITGVFTSAQSAHDNATNGDSLFFEPSQTSYGNITLTKKLILLGTGYFLTENPETQYRDAWPATLGTVVFSKAGSSTSEFSQLMGFTCTGNVTVNVPNITIRRNLLQGTTSLVQTSDPVAYILFAENFCQKSLSSSGILHDIVIRNNLFVFSNYQNISCAATNNGLFMNNIVMATYYYNASISIDNFIVQNNITSYTSYYTNYNSASNNIADNYGFGNQNGNQQYVSMSSVFLYSGSTDGQYRLKSGSPALGAGNGGVDCGAFGGANPYVLSGLPPVPATYFFNIGDPSGPYNVQVKVKSHN